MESIKRCGRGGTDVMKMTDQTWDTPRTSIVVQWFESTNAGGTGLIPGQGPMVRHAMHAWSKDFF